MQRQERVLEGGRQFDHLDTEKVKIDVRPPLFNAENDRPVVDNALVETDDQSTTVTNGTTVVAVVNGLPGPSVFVQGDDTWDVLHIKTELPAGTAATNFVLTVTYTATFTEITSFSGLTSGSVALNVNDDKQVSAAALTVTPSTGTGVYVLLPVTLETLLDDKANSGDSVPNFSVNTVPTVGSFSNGVNIVSHPISKSSTHTKSYPTSTVWIYAVNGGKIDASGTAALVNKDGTSSTVHILGTATLGRLPEWASDVEVSATFSYKYGFVTA